MGHGLIASNTRMMGRTERKRQLVLPPHSGYQQAYHSQFTRECTEGAAPIAVTVGYNMITNQVNEVMLHATYPSKEEAESAATLGDFDRAESNVRAVMARRLPPPGP